jgi:hypothetical protein
MHTAAKSSMCHELPANFLSSSLTRSLVRFVDDSRVLSSSLPPVTHRTTRLQVLELPSLRGKA